MVPADQRHRRCWIRDPGYLYVPNGDRIFPYDCETEKEIEVIEVWEKDLKERGGSAVAEAVSQVIPRGGSHE